MPKVRVRDFLIYVFVIGGLIFILYRFSSFNRSEMQQYQHLKGRLDGVLYDIQSQADIECFDKVSFRGCVFDKIIADNIEYIIEKILKSGSSRGWRLVENKNFGDIRLIAFCDESASIRIELINRSGGVRVRAGSYWSSDPGSNKYCRKETSGSGSP